MSYESLRREYNERGFVVIRGFLSGEPLRELQAELDRYIRDVVPTLPDTAAFYHDKARPDTLKQMQHMTGDAYFAAYARNPHWMAMAEGLLGESANCDGPEWFNKPAGTVHPTPAHQDNYYFCLNPPSVLTAWVALDDVDRENGCLRYVPGSHLRGIRPHGASGVLGFSQGITDYGPDDARLEEEIHLRPGDATIHHGNTIHRADANLSSTRNRRAFAMVIRGASAKRDEEAFARYMASVRRQHETLGLKVGA